MQDLAIFCPNRYPIKVEDFFTTITFLQNVTNLSRYPLSIVDRMGIEPITLSLQRRNAEALEHASP